MRTIRNKVSSRDLLTIAEAKEYLEEVLFSLGTANVDRDVTSEVREINVYFTSTAVTHEYAETLGILGKMATATVIFEPFSNRVTGRGKCHFLYSNG